MSSYLKRLVAILYCRAERFVLFFGRGYYEKHFCEIILHLGQCHVLLLSRYIVYDFDKFSSVQIYSVFWLFSFSSVSFSS